MKIRNREVNIFSMSSLDLFASGMGAFMLLAVMALPFFPNTGDSPELVAKVKEQMESVETQLENAQTQLESAQTQLENAQTQLEQAERERDQAQRQSEAMEKKASELEVPDLDLVICLDITGSMFQEIDRLKVEINDLVDILNKISPTGIGIVAFGDVEWELPTESRDITSDGTALKSFVDRLIPNKNQGAGENPDDPEAVHLALEEAIRLGWRPATYRRHIVVISDSPASDRNSALNQARAFAGIDGRRVSGVSVGAKGGVEAFMQQLSDAGNGVFVRGTENTMIGSILLAVLDT